MKTYILKTVGNSYTSHNSNVSRSNYLYEEVVASNINEHKYYATETEFRAASGFNFSGSRDIVNFGLLESLKNEQSIVEKSTPEKWGNSFNRNNLIEKEEKCIFNEYWTGQRPGEFNWLIWSGDTSFIPPKLKKYVVELKEDLFKINVSLLTYYKGFPTNGGKKVDFSQLSLTDYINLFNKVNASFIENWIFAIENQNDINSQFAFQDSMELFFKVGANNWESFKKCRPKNWKTLDKWVSCIMLHGFKFTMEQLKKRVSLWQIAEMPIEKNTIQFVFSAKKVVQIYLMAA